MLMYFTIGLFSRLLFYQCKKTIHAFIFWSAMFTELHVTLHSGKLPPVFLSWTVCMLNKPPATQVFHLNTGVVFIYHLPAKATLNRFHHVQETLVTQY